MVKTSLIQKLNLIIFLLLTVILVVFDVYKAYYTSFTHDESYTYLNYVNDTFMNIISYKNPFPNNHILNSLLMKFFQFLFGSSELVLRLPNVLAHALYLIFTFKIFNRYNKRNALLFFILINANPFLIDFFSLARGYGIGISLMVAGFYFYCLYIEGQKNKYHALAIFFLCVAATANFALINLVVVFIVVHNLFMFFVSQQKISLKNIWKANYINLIFFFLLVFVCYEPIRKVTSLNMLEFGGPDGIWEDTVRTLLLGFNYYAKYGPVFMIICQILIVILSILFVVKGISYFLEIKDLSIIQKIALFFGLTLFLIILSSIIQHLLFKTPFLISRFALFLFPIFILMSCFLLLDMLQYPSKFITRGCLFFMSFLFFVHTCYTLNANWYYEWQYDMFSKTVIKELDHIKQSQSKGTINLSSNWIFAPTVNFYKQTWRLDWLNINNNKEKQEGDYHYISEEDFRNIPLYEIQVIRHFQPSNNYLVKYIRLGTSIQLKAANNKYVCADGANNNTIDANSDNGWKWETFSMNVLKNDSIVLYSHEAKVLAVEPGNDKKVSAIKYTIDKWSTFTLVKLTNDTVAFKTTEQNYLSLNETTKQIMANSRRIGKNEKFKLIRVN